ncbi:MAG TPA: EutN/CcmL family microcompartment protein [Magnetospirillaceae bacterium]|nr:EutN/CcmL family microcompartment protein [Magnetospirillaceae bacterium]
MASRRVDGLEGARFLLAEDCAPDGEGRGEFHVALDLVGCERGQLVLLAQGSSCRWTFQTEDEPVDALAIGIVDQIDSGGATLWDGAGREP